MKIILLFGVKLYRNEVSIHAINLLEISRMLAQFEFAEQ